MNFEGEIFHSGIFYISDVKIIHERFDILVNFGVSYYNYRCCYSIIYKKDFLISGMVEGIW